jgi:hypothetical protein
MSVTIAVVVTMRYCPGGAEPDSEAVDCAGVLDASQPARIDSSGAAESKTRRAVEDVARGMEFGQDRSVVVFVAPPIDV